MLIRSLMPQDAEVILWLIKQLAGFHHKEHEVSMNKENLMSEIKDWKRIYGMVAADESTWTIAGMLLYSKGFSSRKWKAYIIDDFYVSELYRRQWVGTSLMNTLIKQAAQEWVKRICRYYSTTNQTAELFYSKYAHEEDKELTFCSYLL